MRQPLKYIHSFEDFLNEKKKMDFKLNPLKNNTNIDLQNKFKNISTVFEITELPKKLTINEKVFNLIWQHNENHDIFKRLKERTNLLNYNDLVSHLKYCFKYFINNIIDININTKYAIINVENPFYIIFYIDINKQKINIVTILNNTTITDCQIMKINEKMGKINEYYQYNNTNNDYLIKYTSELLNTIIDKACFFDKNDNIYKINWFFFNNLNLKIINRNEFIMKLNLFMDGINEFLKENQLSDLDKYDLIDTFLSIDTTDYDPSKYYYNP